MRGGGKNLSPNGHLLKFGVGTWDAPATPGVSDSAGEYPGGLSDSESRPERLGVSRSASMVREIVAGP